MRESTKTPLSDPRPGHRLRHALTTCLGLAVVFAVGEVLVRYARSPETFTAPQLSLAVFANVSALGLVAVFLVLVGALMARAVKQIGTKTRFKVVSQIDYAAVGTVIAVLILATDGLGFLAGRPSARVICAVAGGMGLWVFASCTKRFSRQPLTSPARLGVLACWLACLGVTTLAVGRTHTHIASWLRGDTSARSDTITAGPNIVLVVLDTLRADCVGAYADSHLTPNLDRLAESSIVYANATSTAPWTLPAHASLFTGVYPDKHGVNWGHYQLDDRLPTLAALLKERGYDTFALSNNWLLSEENGFARGFDSFLETSRDPFLGRWRLALRCGVARPVLTWMDLPADAAYDAGSAWTNWLTDKRLTLRRENDRPFFAFLNYFEPHDPYRPPERYAKRMLTAGQQQAYARLPQREDFLAAQACGVPGIYGRRQIELMNALYEAEVAYQDEAVGTLIQSLQRAGRLADTWLVVTSDHGELFGEENMVYHTAGSHYKLLHVPMFVRPPGGVERRTVEAPVQPVDVFVTLLEQAGSAIPAHVQRAYRLPMTNDRGAERTVSVAQTHGASIAGLSMAQRMDMQADFSRWLSWVTSVSGDGYLLEMDSHGPWALFNVSVDPEMNENLADLLPEVVESLVVRFHEWVAQANSGDIL